MPTSCCRRALAGCWRTSAPWTPNSSDFVAWAKHSANPTLVHAAEIFVIPDAFPVGTRVAKLDGEGYLPIGFFQLWNAARTGVRSYPDEHGTAGRADMIHALRWPRSRRALIPELFVTHLGSEIDKGRTNWRGRISKPFGPVTAPCASNPGSYS